MYVYMAYALDHLYRVFRIFNFHHSTSTSTIPLPPLDRCDLIGRGRYKYRYWLDI